MFTQEQVEAQVAEAVAAARAAAEAEIAEGARLLEQMHKAQTLSQLRKQLDALTYVEPRHRESLFEVAKSAPESAVQPLLAAWRGINKQFEALARIDAATRDAEAQYRQATNTEMGVSRA